jgi:hypothetical protein
LGIEFSGWNNEKCKGTDKRNTDKYSNFTIFLFFPQTNQDDKVYKKECNFVNIIIADETSTHYNVLDYEFGRNSTRIRKTIEIL